MLPQAATSCHVHFKWHLARSFRLKEIYSHGSSIPKPTVVVNCNKTEFVIATSWSVDRASVTEVRITLKGAFRSSIWFSAFNFTACAQRSQWLSRFADFRCRLRKNELKKGIFVNLLLNIYTAKFKKFQTLAVQRTCSYLLPFHSSAITSLWCNRILFLTDCLETAFGSSESETMDLISSVKETCLRYSLVHQDFVSFTCLEPKR